MKQPRKPWTVQWHIAPDGTVIRQRSRGDEPHQQLFGSYSTKRRLEIADLDALDDLLARDRKFFGVLVAGFLVVGAAGLAGIVVGTVLGWLEVDAARYLVVPGVIAFIVAMIASGSCQGMMISRFNRRWTECGFESPKAVTMSAREARVIVASPGAVSGRKTRVKRA